ncbi:hypothetical protein NKH95_17575 [Mesorhizobium sp. M0848]|uniref:hypothetical protein n=1 Tax=Mesorhizobium sp. M0848 TaxID=2957012 RepID=UPI00333C9118
MRYHQIVQKRRELSRPGFLTLADVGMDGPWVSPYQIISKSMTGPVLLANNWLDEQSITANLPLLRKRGYLPGMVFNDVLDLINGFDRKAVYVTQVFHLVPDMRYGAKVSQAAFDESFDTVTRHELLDRSVVALGKRAANMCRRHGVKCIETRHPSHGGITYADRAKLIGSAITQAGGLSGH